MDALLKTLLQGILFFRRLGIYILWSSSCGVQQNYIFIRFDLHHFSHPVGVSTSST